MVTIDTIVLRMPEFEVEPCTGRQRLPRLGDEPANQVEPVCAAIEREPRLPTRDLGLQPASSGCYVSDELLGEFCRWGGAEMHGVASVMGGIASQEVIKAVTHQYQPLNNTFIFNGHNGTTATFDL